jgi:hypothetical protein
VLYRMLPTYYCTAISLMFYSKSWSKLATCCIANQPNGNWTSVYTRRPSARRLPQQSVQLLRRPVNSSRRSQSLKKQPHVCWSFVNFVKTRQKTLMRFPTHSQSSGNLGSLTLKQTLLPLRLLKGVFICPESVVWAIKSRSRPTRSTCRRY